MSLFISTWFNISHIALLILSFSEVVGSKLIPHGYEMTSLIIIVVKRVFNRSFADSTCAHAVD
jgi:hypothetical protein